MTPRNSHFYSQDLLCLVQRQSCHAPLTKKLEDTLKVGPSYGRAWYNSQREHWLQWLAEYPTAGPYGRKPVERTRAQVVYNRINCPPMVFWLAEAVGVHKAALDAAHAAAIAAPYNLASQTGAIRSELPWGLVFRHILGSYDNWVGFVAGKSREGNRDAIATSCNGSGILCRTDDFPSPTLQPVAVIGDDTM